MNEEKVKFLIPKNDKFKEAKKKIEEVIEKREDLKDKIEIEETEEQEVPVAITSDDKKCNILIDEENNKFILDCKDKGTIQI